MHEFEMRQQRLERRQHNPRRHQRAKHLKATRSEVVERLIFNCKREVDAPQQRPLPIDHAGILERVPGGPVTLIITIRDRPFERARRQQAQQGRLAATRRTAHEHQAGPGVGRIAQNLDR